MSEVLQATRVETPRGISLADSDWVIEQVFERVPEEEIQRSLGKFAVQLEVLPEFNKENHLSCILPETPGNSWYRKIGKKFWDKYRSAETVPTAELEISAICQNVDTVIWGELNEPL